MCQAHGPSTTVGCSKCGQSYREGSQHVCPTPLVPADPGPRVDTSGEPRTEISYLTTGNAPDAKGFVSAPVPATGGATPKCPVCNTQLVQVGSKSPFTCWTCPDAKTSHRSIAAATPEPKLEEVAWKCAELAKRKFDEAMEEEGPAPIVLDLRASDFMGLLRPYFEAKGAK